MDYRYFTLSIKIVESLKISSCIYLIRKCKIITKACLFKKDNYIICHYKFLISNGILINWAGYCENNTSPTNNNMNSKVPIFGISNFI